MDYLFFVSFLSSLAMKKLQFIAKTSANYSYVSQLSVCAFTTITIDFKVDLFIKYFDCFAVLIGNTSNNPVVTQPPPPYQPPPGMSSLTLATKFAPTCSFFFNVIIVDDYWIFWWEAKYTKIINIFM